MQEAPNFYKKDEQQERGNYDSAKILGISGQVDTFSFDPKEEGSLPSSPAIGWQTCLVRSFRYLTWHIHTSA